MTRQWYDIDTIGIAISAHRPSIRWFLGSRLQRVHGVWCIDSLYAKRSDISPFSQLWQYSSKTFI